MAKVARDARAKVKLELLIKPANRRLERRLRFAAEDSQTCATNQLVIFS